MENASKALLIAGAILVCILLIGIGMLVYGSAQGTIDEAVSQMSSQEKDMFNRQFTQYEGQRVNGSNVKALISKINNNNSQIDDDKDPKHVTLSGIDSKNINTARTYSVTCEDTDKDGLIDKVTVADVKNK